MDLKNFINFGKLKDKINEKANKKSFMNLLILVLVGVLLAILSNTFKETTTYSANAFKTNETAVGEKTNSVQENTQTINNEEQDVEKKLKDTLENIEGVGSVKVMVYFKGGEEQIPAININDSTSLTEEKDVDGGTRKITQKNDGRSIVMMNTEDGTKPFVVKQYKPEVTGVFIVAEGADNNLIKLQIQKAVINLFDLKEDQVNVYPMKK